MGKPEGTRLGRQLTFAGLWVLSALLLAGSSRAPNERVRVVDARAKTVLEPEGIWSVPLLGVAALDSRAAWPYGLFVLAGSLLLALAGRRMLLRDIPPAAVFVAVTGLALAARSEQLLLAGIVFVMVAAVHSEWSQQRKLFAALGCLAASVLASIEFGFVICLGLLIFLPEIWGHCSRRGRFLFLGGTIVCLGALWQVPGFIGTGARPFRGAVLDVPGSIFSESFTAFSSGHDWRLELPLALFFLYCWVTLAWKAERRGWNLLTLSLLTVLGLCNVRYFWIAGLTLALSQSVPARSELPARLGHAVLALALLLGLIRFLPQGGTYLDWALGEATSPRVEPAEWGIRGPVVLLDLSQSADWQSTRTRERFSLMMDDRWEVFQGQYRSYAAVCRDLREILADSYLRDDQNWGGYRRWLNEWSPALLVANSENLWDIRRLSLSPHWRVVGIDARRTIFGSSQDQTNFEQSAKAHRMMTELEWPPLAPGPWHDNVIVASTRDDLRKVSQVLTALRLPYAALRLLPEDDTPEIRGHRAWCHLEIAHRVYRHSGRGSLLDQFRGVHGLRRMLAEPDHGAEEKVRGLLSLEGLGLDRLANQLAEDWIRSGAESSLPLDSWNRLAALSDRTAKSLSAQDEPIAADAEAKLHRALLEGDLAAAREELGHVEPPLRDYYGLIVSSVEVPLSELFTDWSQVLEQPDFPDHRRGEALFGLGCVALELGNTEAAIAAFRESDRVDPQSPFHALNQMYRLQLGDR